MELKTRTVVSVFSKSKLPASDYVVNSYIGCPHHCRYCYAEFMKRFTNHPEPWGDFLEIKEVSKPENLKRYEGKKLMFSSVTDPYHPYEALYRKTRAVLQDLLNAGVQPSITISTKSDLVLSDIDLLQQFQDIVVACSINTMDEDFRRAMDRGAAIEKRLRALQQLHAVGIRTAIFISPIFPGLTDAKLIIDQSRDYVDEYWLENLNLRGGYRKAILHYIEEQHPSLMPLYHQIYVEKDRSYWDDLAVELASYGEQQGVNIINYFYHERIRKK